MSDYLAPYGSADPNASYVDKNSGGGVNGSRVPGLAIEMPQREIKTVLLAAGLVPDRNDPTQLNEAIDKKIELATAGGENPLNDLLDLLRARLRIYPEILTADGRFNLTVPSTGNLQIPSGIVILHRGVFPVTTVLQNFTTLANKTYHLRYRFTGTPGWALVDFSDAGYNLGLEEDNIAFDSSLDDMISHKIVTDASNVATITALANKDRILITGQLVLNSTQRSLGLSSAVPVNLARRPTASMSHCNDIRRGADGGEEVDFGVAAASRYSLNVWYRRSVLFGGDSDNGTVGWSAAL